MSDADAMQRPTNDEDREGWKDYWAKTQPQDVSYTFISKSREPSFCLAVVAYKSLE